VTITWQDIAAIVSARKAVPGWRYGSRRGWYIPSPTGGSFSAEVTLRPRWCEIVVDRWRTTDRDERRSGPWFEQHIWPAVDAALLAKRGGWGMLPAGHTLASASPLHRDAIPELLTAWIDAELAWGIDADQQWPEFAPHKVVPGPQGNYG
jgi:hypothetical protein